MAQLITDQGHKLEVVRQNERQMVDSRRWRAATATLDQAEKYKKKKKKHTLAAGGNLSASYLSPRLKDKFWFQDQSVSPVPPPHTPCVKHPVDDSLPIHAPPTPNYGCCEVHCSWITVVLSCMRSDWVVMALRLRLPYHGKVSEISCKGRIKRKGNPSWTDVKQAAYEKSLLEEPLCGLIFSCHCQWEKKTRGFSVACVAHIWSQQVIRPVVC